jgi:hypothetical protein
VLVSGEIKDLPAKGVAAARLLVPVIAGHSKGAGKLGVVFFKAPFDSGKTFPAAELAELAGTTVIPLQPADMPAYNPAKLFPIDTTRAVRALASGEMKFNGLALRMVPDRGIDDGYTIRCDVSPAEKMILEVDIYAD